MCRHGDRRPTSVIEELARVELPDPEILVRAISDGRRLGLQMAFLDGASTSLKRAGAGWSTRRRMWVIDAQPAPRALAWMRTTLAGRPFDADSALAMLRQAEGVADQSYFTEVLDVQLFPLLDGAGFAVTSAYDALVVRAMRSLGGRFHGGAQAWQVQSSRDEVLEALRTIAGVESDVVFCHETALQLEELTAGSKPEVPITIPAASPDFGGGELDPDKEREGTGFLTTVGEASVRLDVDRDLLTAHCAQAQLRDYQVLGVEHMVTQIGACLADDMGLGKSRQTVVSARFVAGMDESGLNPCAPPGRALLVCPTSLRINWEREILAVYPDAVIGMVGEDRMATLHGCEWIIASYERLGALVKEPALTFRVMAVDEAHNIKEHDAGRTRNAFILASRIPRCYAITGTPLLNREIELHTLLRLTRHPLGLLTLKDFRKSYAGGAAQREALASALRGWMLRRSKGVLTELGTKERRLRWISPAGGMQPYIDQMADMTLTVMPKLGKLRQCLEAMKVDFLVETVESLDQGDKVIIFVSYLATVDVLRQAFQQLGVKVVTLVGPDSTTKRQAAVDAFQRDAQARVFITTVAAGGVGITLTAANYVLFGSLPWTPALMRQAEDRAYRLGQLRDVEVLVPLIPNTIDEQLWALLGSKTQLEQDVVEASVAKLLPA